MSNKEIQYNKAVRDHYKNDSDRQEFDREQKSRDRVEALGYYSSKIITGYLIGCVIGAILGCMFVYYIFIKPWVIPIIKYLFN